MAPSFQRSRPASGPLVQGFAGGGFSVDGKVYPALLLTPERAAAWTPPLLAELRPEDLQPLLDLSPAPEFILVGTGPAMAFPPRTLVRELEKRGIGVEAMDSRAAARTWGLLRAEERWIAAAIMGL
ncbi:Mth938-like domain-containing protein [Sphingosinicella terrae]|uniref:Mth938-like domain-containing protein n=1 Tax=Sphingosinicella terrae TaxID=2172047 RepID=UPI000E0E0126|nr:Mth938-like domain-containing protein [Sphingosinicella terrae]